MSKSNPFTATFGYQQTVIEQTQNVALETLGAQKTALQQLADRFETSKELQTHGNELKRTTLHAYFDAIERAAPEADLTTFHELVDDGIDILEQNYEQNWETAIEGLEEFEEATDSYSETVDDSFDSFLAAQAQVEDSTATVAEQIETAAPDNLAAD
jgi:DNA-binding SARP family transcriptional activator